MTIVGLAQDILILLSADNLKRFNTLMYIEVFRLACKNKREREKFKGKPITYCVDRYYW